jgi:hypothetical protein
MMYIKPLQRFDQEVLRKYKSLNHTVINYINVFLFVVL